MEEKYILKKSIRVAKMARVLAKVVDLFIAFILILPFYPLGVFFALFYLAFCDYLQDGQSVGKKFIGLRVVSLEDGSPCSKRQSAVRNLPFLIPIVFLIFPLWGGIITALVGIPLCLLELYLILNLDSGHRMGDVMADTTVMAHDDSREFLKKKAAGAYPTT